MNTAPNSIIKVGLKKRSYNILVGNGALKSLGSSIRKLDIGNSAYVVTNFFLRKKFGAQLEKTLKAAGFSVRFRLVADSEKSKSMETASQVINDIAQYDKKRSIFIVAFGGGVIGDLCGFIASVYKRGIPYIQVPTTLLAQVDSGIGGKAAVDLSRAKNLVGAFYQPRLVLNDTGLLKTLGLRQARSGLAEVIKYAVIKDQGLFLYLEKNYKNVLSLEGAALNFIVKRCAAIKAKIVQRDEKETKGIRTTLNFGHTIGHAIEAAAGFKRYSHGEAISLGMLLAADISRLLGLINSITHQRIGALIKKAGLPAKIKGARPCDIIESYYRDKKFSGKNNKFVLISGLGRTKIVENVPLKIIKKVIKERL